MYKKLCNTMTGSAIFCSLFLCGMTAQAEPVNLSLVKKQLKQYHDEGGYQQELQQALLRAQSLLSKEIQRNAERKKHKRLAIVFDIDETTLSNYPTMTELDFGGSLPMIEQRIELGRDPAIEPSHQLYQYAKQHNVAVFFVTGRPQHSKAVTIKNLQAAGYDSWQGIYFKPENYHQKSVIPYKSQARHKISQQGYEVVETIGDQWSDVKGGYALYEIKLPNPFYLIP